MIVGVNSSAAFVSSYRALGPRLPYNGVGNKVDDGGGRSTLPKDTVTICRSARPRSRPDLLALGNGYDLIRWLSSDRQWSLVHCQHLDLFCRLTMQLLQILLKSCMASDEVQEAYLVSIIHRGILSATWSAIQG